MSGAPPQHPAGLASSSRPTTIAAPRMVIRAVKAASSRRPTEVIVVDDGSTALLNAVSSPAPIRRCASIIRRTATWRRAEPGSDGDQGSIFYTDGDAQTSGAALLWATEPDHMVNGYKISRATRPSHRHRPRPPPHRQPAVRPLAARCRLRFPVDAALDLRPHQPHEDGGIICVEMMKRSRTAASDRTAGTISPRLRQIAVLQLSAPVQTGRDLPALCTLVARREHLRPGVLPLARTATDPANRVYAGPPRL